MGKKTFKAVLGVLVALQVFAILIEIQQVRAAMRGGHSFATRDRGRG
jgi:hypothetical protein